ncbi:MAG: hypothetical protein AAF702_18050 [Chloroflexota bacterium]
MDVAGDVSQTSRFATDSFIARPILYRIIAQCAELFINKLFSPIDANRASGLDMFYHCVSVPSNFSDHKGSAEWMGLPN